MHSSSLWTTLKGQVVFHRQSSLLLLCFKSKCEAYRGRKLVCPDHAHPLPPPCAHESGAMVFWLLVSTKPQLLLHCLASSASDPHWATGKSVRRLRSGRQLGLWSSLSKLAVMHYLVGSCLGQCVEVCAADQPCLLLFQAVGAGICEHEEWLELSPSFRKGSLSVRIQK